MTSKQQDKKSLEFVVKKYIHARVLKKINATDLEKKLIYDETYFVVKGFNDRIELRRDKLLMLGDNCCYFVFKLKR